MKVTPKPSAKGKALSREARLRQGLEARTKLSRSKLGDSLAHKRKFDPVERLISSDAGGVEKLLPLKYARMSTSSFAYFRGAVSVMAADLADEPHTRCMVQLCGDAHVQNLGSFESPDGRIAFDINDFDETIPGPWEWDVKRMATSIVLAGAESQHNKAACRAAAESFIKTYCLTIEELAEQPILVAARHVIHRLKQSQAISAALQQARRATPLDLLKKYTTKNAKGQFAFKEVEGVLWRISGKPRDQVLNSLSEYTKILPSDRLHLFSFFGPRDVAFKVVGTGSVGLRDYVVLMEGNGSKDPLFLQIKQEVASAYSSYLNNALFSHQGQRVAEGQRRIQPISDMLLGWTRIGDDDFLVRQLNDHKGSIDIQDLARDGLIGLATVAGELLGRGHARSGDALTIKGYIGAGDKVAQAIARYAVDYAAATESDFADFKKAIEDGRIEIAS